MGLVFAMSSSALAGPDWEFSARHNALAETGNAIFNLNGLSPSLENLACLVGTSRYNILQEGTTNTVNMFSSKDDIDYYTRQINARTGLKTIYPAMRGYDDYDYSDRLVIAFVPGISVSNLSQKVTYNGQEYADDQFYGNSDEETTTTTRAQFFQRFGIAYGINEYVALGFGFTLIPPTIISVSKFGEVTKPDPETGDTSVTDPKDNYTTYSPFMFSPEIGIIARPIEILQLGLTFEAGDLKSRSADVTHKTATGDTDEKTQSTSVRSPNLGFGWAVMIPDIEKFMVAFDFDMQWRRGDASEYGFYAENQEAQFTVSIEKAFEMSSIKGGFGYTDAVGTDRYMPYDRFFFAFGTDLYFDEHIMMGLSFRGETGYLSTIPQGGPAFGGGLAWSFGGSF
jgi:hypothetical protein